MKTDITYTAEIYTDTGEFVVFQVSASPNAIIGTIYEKYPRCQIVRYF